MAPHLSVASARACTFQRVALQETPAENHLRIHHTTSSPSNRSTSHRSDRHGQSTLTTVQLPETEDTQRTDCPKQA
eukprot:2992690-Pleurochrysis_carterae.AAC.2